MKCVLARAPMRDALYRISIQNRRFTLWRCWITLLLLCAFTSLICLAGGQSKSESELKIQSIIGSFASRLGITPHVMVIIEPKNPRLISVEYAPGRTDLFQMSFEEGFMRTLDDTELRAAIAHEMGHIWIYTHFPFLQTEMLANQQARKLVARNELARVYEKVWARNGEKGDLIAVLGPEEDSDHQRGTSVAEAAVDPAASHEAEESSTHKGPRIYVETGDEPSSLAGISDPAKHGNLPVPPAELADSLTKACPGCIMEISKVNADYVVTVAPGPLHEGLMQWSWAVYQRGGALLDKGATSIAGNSEQEAFRTLLTHWRRALRRQINQDRESLRRF